jgi:hypothetical protein
MGPLVSVEHRPAARAEVEPLGISARAVYGNTEQIAATVAATWGDPRRGTMLEKENRMTVGGDKEPAVNIGEAT